MPDDVKPASPLPWGATGWVHSDDLETMYPSIHDANDDSIVDFDACDNWDFQDAAYIVAACNAYPGLVARVAALEAELAQEKQDHADDLDALASVRAERDRLRKALGLLTTDDVAEWLEANKHARAALAPKEPS